METDGNNLAISYGIYVVRCLQSDASVMFALAKYHFLDSNHGGFKQKRGYKANAIGKQQTSQVNRGGQIIAVKQRTPHVLGNDDNDQQMVEISGVVDSSNGSECTPGE